MATGGDEQKRHFAGLFDRAADSYDAVGVDFFTPLAAALVERADLRPGMNVLDVGTGSGASLRAAAGFVGASGHAHGLELSPGMVARARQQLADLPQVTIEEGDADAPPRRDGGWDAAVAALLLFYLPDPVGSASRIRSVLRTGGTFVASTFDSADERWKIVEGAVSPFWPVSDEPSHPSGSSPFATVASTERLLEAAGFTDLDTTVIEHTNVYSDVEHWLRWTWSAGARGMWERLAEGDRADAQAAACEVVASLAEPDGSLAERFRIRLTRAVAP